MKIPVKGEVHQQHTYEMLRARRALKAKHHYSHYYAASTFCLVTSTVLLGAPMCNLWLCQLYLKKVVKKIRRNKDFFRDKKAERSHL